MMDPLESLIIHPEIQREGFAAADLLSQVLANIRLTGDRVYACRLECGDTLALDDSSAHVCMLREGELSVQHGEQPRMSISRGDILLLPHTLSGLSITAATAQVDVVVCRFWFDASSFQAMVFALPWLIHIKQADAAAWSEGILHFMLLEANDTQPGGTLMVSRLIDLIVIRLLRTWVQQGEASGWLRALADARVARALKAIHEAPGQQWSIAGLAALAGMSRSSFCERFNTLVGRPPLRYQNEWRLTLARSMLLKGGRRVGEVGFAIGYGSEAAFSRAYKAFFGRSPRDDNAWPAAQDQH
ncbi:AraC family transcriptional regulator [Pseudomonas putida]